MRTPPGWTSRRGTKTGPVFLARAAEEDRVGVLNDNHNEALAEKWNGLRELRAWGAVEDGTRLAKLSRVAPTPLRCRPSNRSKSGLVQENHKPTHWGWLHCPEFSGSRSYAIVSRFQMPGRLLDEGCSTAALHSPSGLLRDRRMVEAECNTGGLRPRHDPVQAGDLHHKLHGEGRLDGLPSMALRYPTVSLKLARVIYRQAHAEPDH